MRISIYTDGGSRGNPGPSGYGIVIYDEHQRIISQMSQYIGHKTNNEAEYHALIASLNWLESHLAQNHISAVSFYSDSELLVRQLQGTYRVKAPTLKPLYQTVIFSLKRLNLPFTFNHILRESNALADSLANQAMDHAHE